MSKKYTQKSESRGNKSKRYNQDLDFDFEEEEISPKELSRLNKKIQKQKKKKMTRNVGLVMAGIQIITFIIFTVFLFILNVLPTKYLTIVIIVMLLISAYDVASQFSKAHVIGKILSCILSILFIFGSIYISQAVAALDNVSGADTKVDNVEVIVLSGDAAQALSDAKNYTFGYHSVLDKTNTDKTIASINSDLGTTIKTKSYTDLVEMINALYSKKIGAIIINESYVDTLEDTFPEFSTQTRVLSSETFETKIEAKTTKDVTKDTFTIYLSGNDSYGSLSKSGRSDVNILLTVNPKTRQILLVNTPRDYYVNVNSLTSGTGKDKLTHAGTFGVDASMATLESLYGVDIDYYVKLNFTGTVDIVDALGGIIVDSEIAFTTCTDTAPIIYNFKKGSNTLDGAATLAFCRERQTIAGGDNQRGRNQMIVVNGIINKVSSTAILSKYSSVLESISSLFETSLSQTEISNLVKVMLNDPSGWNIQNYNVTGTGTTGISHFYGYTGLSVIEPNYTTVSTATTLMGKIKSGETFSVDDYVTE